MVNELGHFGPKLDHAWLGCADFLCCEPHRVGPCHTVLGPAR